MNKRKVRTYNLEFKQSSAKLAAGSEQSISDTAKELGISVSTLHGWVNKYAPSAAASKPNEMCTYEEFKRLKKENIKLKQERDILKKAAAYFANETL